MVNETDRSMCVGARPAIRRGMLRDGERVETADPATPVVGVLAIQGDYLEHEEALHAHGIATRRVRRPEHLEGIDGLVLPGGESTTMLRLLRIEALDEPLIAAIRRLPTFATCAGLILVASRVTHPEQRSFGLLDVTVARNGYGRQLHSGTFALEVEPAAELGPGADQGVFIRAPRILEVGPEVRVLARRGDDPVLVEQGTILAAGFHPELQTAHPVVARFAARVREQAARRLAVVSRRDRAEPTPAPGAAVPS